MLDLSCIGQCLATVRGTAGRDISRIDVPRKHAIVFQVGKPESDAHPEVRRELAVVREVHIQVREQIVRTHIPDAFLSPDNFLNDLAENLPAADGDLGGFVIACVAVEIFQFDPETGVPDMVADSRAEQNAFIGPEIVSPDTVRTTIRAGAVVFCIAWCVVDRHELGVYVLVAHTGPVGVVPVSIQRLPEVHPQFATDVKALGVRRTRGDG